MRQKISIIGVGHLGKVLVLGLIAGKTVKEKNLLLSNPHLDKLQEFKKDYGVRLTTNNIEASKFADILIIAVKPMVVEKVARGVRNYIQKDALIISTAACVTIELLEKYFIKKGSDLKVFQGLIPKIIETPKIVRIMPNIPIAYGLGVIGWIGNKQINNDNKKFIKYLFASLGYLIECKNETQLDRLSMISGCGPGYVGYFISNLEKVARSYGFSEEKARKIVEATFFGTLHHLKRKKIPSVELVSSVATKGGITEEVIKSIENSNFYQILLKSIKKGYDKIGKITMELERKLGNDKL